MGTWGSLGVQMGDLDKQNYQNDLLNDPHDTQISHKNDPQINNTLGGTVAGNTTLKKNRGHSPLPVGTVAVLKFRQSTGSSLYLKNTKKYGHSPLPVETFWVLKFSRVQVVALASIIKK